MANTYLTRTVASTGDRTKATFSAWVKKSDTSSEQFLFYNYESGTTNFRIRFNPEVLQVETLSGSSVVGTLTTNRKFRDPSAWYHIVVSIDSTSGTADDRMKIYVNGVQETSFSARTNPPQNQNMAFNESSHVQYIGSQVTSNYFNGCMSHYYWIDGTAYTPSTFGSTDSVTGEWKINTSPSITMGTNGFTILKDGNTITDQSSNSNNFTLGGGTLTNTEDCPSNVFATLNPLYQQTTGEGVVLSYGNTKGYYASNSSRSCFGSIAQSSGKYYYECKIPAGTGTVVVGIVDLAWSGLNGAAGAFHDNALNFGYNVSGQKTSGGVNTAYGSAISDNDILGCAMDLDNGKLYFSLNGSWQGSGDPTSGSTGTGSAFNLASGANYTAACRLRNGTICEFNFGNGYFGTTQISSEGTNASGIGKFEYDVPTGYTALSTKGLNE